MKTIILLFCIQFLIGCTSVQLDERITSMPLLLEQTELPTIPESIFKSSFRIEFKMLIDENGKVKQAHLISGSGNSAWDSLAIKSIRNWKYDPGRFENKPVKMWVYQRALINIENPYYLSLAQIVCDSLSQANSIIAQLKLGKDFYQLAKIYKKDSLQLADLIMNKKNIYLYPKNISSALRKLELGEYTDPIEYGKKYVIFKRVEN